MVVKLYHLLVSSIMLQRQMCTERLSNYSFATFCKLLDFKSIHECEKYIDICLCYNAALDISTGPLARRTFQTAGPVRPSTFYLSLARTGHLDICRATRFQIVLARTMTIHSMYFSRGRPSHISAVFAHPFCYSETPACRESESGMSIKHTDVSV